MILALLLFSQAFGLSLSYELKIKEPPKAPLFWSFPQDYYGKKLEYYPEKVPYPLVDFEFSLFIPKSLCLFKGHGKNYEEINKNIILLSQKKFKDVLENLKKDDPDTLFIRFYANLFQIFEGKKAEIETIRKTTTQIMKNWEQHDNGIKKIHLDFSQGFNYSQSVFLSKDQQYFDVTLDKEPCFREEWESRIMLPTIWNMFVFHKQKKQEPFLYKYEDLLLRNLSLPKESPFFLKEPKVQSLLRFQPKSHFDAALGLFLLKSQMALQRKDYLAAIDNLKGTFVLNNITKHHEYWIFSMIGNLFFCANDFRVAQLVFSQAMSIKPPEINHSGALFYLGETSFWQGNYQQAIVYFKMFLEKFSDRDFTPWARLRLAEMGMQLRDKDLWQEHAHYITQNLEFHPSFMAVNALEFCQAYPDYSIKRINLFLETFESQMHQLQFQNFPWLIKCQLEAGMHAFKLESQDLNFSEFVKAYDKNRILWKEKQNFMNQTYDSLDDYSLIPIFEAYENNDCSLFLKLIQERKDLTSTVPVLKWTEKQEDFYDRCLFISDKKWEPLDKKRPYVPTSERSALRKEYEKLKISVDNQFWKKFIISQDLKRFTQPIEVYQDLDSLKKNLKKDDFWQRVKAQKFMSMAWKPYLKKADAKLWVEEVLKGQIDFIYRYEGFCKYFKESLSQSQYSKVYSIKSVEQWKKDLQSSGCQKEISSLLWAYYINNYEKDPANQWVIPTLKEKGYEQEGDTWLLFLHQAQGKMKNKELKEHYDALFRDSKDRVIKKTAENWLVSNGYSKNSK